MYIILRKMPTITIVKEKNGQVKYKLNLPKDLMDTLAVKTKDRMDVVAMMGDTITFKLNRAK
jgi:hypothetical protein